MEDLSGRVAVVTGGASGIGSGMCRAFASEGMAVVVADLDLERAARFAEELRGTGARAVGLHVDTSDHASVEKLAQASLSELGRVDVVCNNAGVYIGGPMSELTVDDWRWVMAVNLDGVFHGCQVFAPLLKQAGRGGHIVNTSSIGGFLVADTATAYSVSKFGVLALSDGLRDDLKPHGIGVSALCPGPVRTRLADSDERRPSTLGSVGQHSDVLWDMIKDGIEPEAVGPIVVRGIRANARYIFTHAEWRAALEKRFQAALDAFSLLEG